MMSQANLSWHKKGMYLKVNDFSPIGDSFLRLHNDLTQIMQGHPGPDCKSLRVPGDTSPLAVNTALILF